MGERTEQPANPKSPPFKTAGVILAMSFLLQWLVQSFSYGMGNGVAPAEVVVALGGFIGVPAVLLIGLIALWSGFPVAVRIGLGALGLTLVNTGLICLFTASPMESADYDYSLIDRYPDQAGATMLALGAIIVVVAAVKRRGRPKGPAPAPPPAR